jgi:hypothetical protein
MRIMVRGSTSDGFFAAVAAGRRQKHARQPENMQDIGHLKRIPSDSDS